MKYHINYKFDTRISGLLRWGLHHAQTTPLKSETDWTGELWSKTEKKIIQNFEIFLKSHFFRFSQIFFSGSGWTGELWSNLLNWKK